MGGQTAADLAHDWSTNWCKALQPSDLQQLENYAFAIFASFNGTLADPDWYLNVVERPHVEIEVGVRVFRRRARTAIGHERDEMWERQKVAYPEFADIEARTTRVTPVVVLEPEED